ncbi:MAG: helix-turn-helix domain-containing protein [Chloroflexaceae bacterium]
MHDDTLLDQQIGQRIAAARQAAGLTVRDLAARLGWPHTTLSNYEVGRRSLPVSRLYAIAAALQRTPAALLIDLPEAAAIVDTLEGNPERCLQVQMVLETLDEPLPEPVE